IPQRPCSVPRTVNDGGLTCSTRHLAEPRTATVNSPNWELISAAGHGDMRPRRSDTDASDDRVHVADAVDPCVFSQVVIKRERHDRGRCGYPSSTCAMHAATGEAGDRPQ